MIRMSKTTTKVLLTVAAAAWAAGSGAGIAGADPYLPHVPGLPGPPGIGIGGPPIIPPGQINRLLPPPGQVAHVEDLVPDWR